MNKNCGKKTTAHSQNILHEDALYNIKRKKYKTGLCRIGIRQSHLRQNGHDLFYRACNDFFICYMLLDYCNIQRVFDQK
jgi:hypothetical protein